MTYEETLNYLTQQLPMFQRIGSAAFKPGLERIEALCAHLGNPEREFPTLHIAGTNGKGSVASMLAAALTASGYKTGLFTSPHLKDFRERIRIDGKEVAGSEVLNFVQEHKEFIDDLKPSFFEVCTAMAFQAFARAGVEVAVIEVGLGGRLDSTNVLQPELTAITHIGMDHVSILGDTLAKIAAEKAGIIKKGIPVVLGKNEAHARGQVIQKALLSGSELIYPTEKYRIERLSGDLFQQTFDVEGSDFGRMHGLVLDLPGHYQQENLAVALGVLEKLQERAWNITKDSLRQGLSQVRKLSGLQGRMQVLYENPLVMADIAHNPSGVASVVRQLKAAAKGKLRIVWGMSPDKDHRKILDLLPKEAAYYWVKAKSERALEATGLQEKARAAGLEGEVWPSVRKGTKAALDEAGPEDLIWVGGSAFVVAEVV